jgi:CRISPR/Cas system-associated exonuclease Cas4 (RecB family)
MPDKFAATWVSHSSISDYLVCPRSYFLKNVYKDFNTGHKITLMSPPLALGQAVHNTLEALSALPRDKRFSIPLPDRFKTEWEKVSGKRGGFFSETSENKYRTRGEAMISRVFNHPGPIVNLSVKIQKDLPNFWLSEEEEIILCGKVDWLEYLEDQDAVHIIDFKTGKNRENESSLQLPIYHLLVHECQKRNVVKASYWYLEDDDELTEKELPVLDEAREQILNIARKIKLARQLKKFDCPKGEDGCYACGPIERILKGEGELIGEDNFRRDLYVLAPKELDENDEDDSVIL